MAEKKSKKREKYITERISKAGTHSFEICIRMNEQTFRKSIRIDEFNTPGEALSVACKIRDEKLIKMREGRKVTGFKTVEYIFEESYAVLPVSKRTKYRHDIYFRKALAPYANTPIDKITAADIQTCLNKYSETHTHDETGKMLAVWRRLYKYCAMKNMSIPDRSMAVQVPKGIQGTHRAKDTDSDKLEVFCKALLEYNSASVSGSYDCYSVYYAIRVMQYLGLRPAEAFALTRKDVDFEKDELTINKAVHSTITSDLDIGNTKTEDSERVLPIPGDLRKILIEVFEWSRHELLFARYNGKLWDISDADTLIMNVRMKCNIEFRMYMLRHQFSTDLINAGVPLNVVRDLMGHSSESMTLDYATSNEDERRKALNNRKFGKK